MTKDSFKDEIPLFMEEPLKDIEITIPSKMSDKLRYSFPLFIEKYTDREINTILDEKLLRKPWVTT